jgi:hypothetical protein
VPKIKQKCLLGAKTNKLSTWSSVIVEKLTVAQLAKKLLYFAEPKGSKMTENEADHLSASRQASEYVALCSHIANTP